LPETVVSRLDPFDYLTPLITKDLTPLITMLFIPCAATVAVMRQETGSWRWTLFGVGLLLVVALGASALVYQGCRLLGFGMG
jgi:Fe2+ transport system protein B